MARATVITAVAVTLGITGVACGGGSSSSGSSGSSQPAQLSASQWVGNVCGSLSNWKNELDATNNTLQSTVNSSTDLQQVKTQLANFFGSAATSTTNLVSKVQTAGAPAVNNGANIAQGLVGGLQSLQGLFAQTQTQVQALPVDDPTAFSAQVKTLSSSFENTANQASASVKSLETKNPSATLNHEFDSQAACQSLK
jgi:hypothetical protein